MKALRVMAIVMMVSFVGVCMISCGGQKAEAPAVEEAAAPVEAVADSCQKACACDSCACDSCACAADSCVADSCQKACCAADSCKKAC
ncbi:MAG: hypothetical protein K6E86_04960 [Bacteroidales bacterium]|nr:hypothetical protein [Bacteroidales bacterium]